MMPIRVYRADLGQLCAEACMPHLSSQEKGQASRLTNRASRHEFVATRALLRQLLSMHTGEPPGRLAFTTGPCGKPFLPGRHGVHFNVSHSHGMALVAIGPAEMGIDIERIDGTVDCDGVAETMFSAAEIELLRCAAAARRSDVFFSIWTRKEAYLKATGLGFSSGLAMISTASPDGAIGDQGNAPDGRRWHAFDLPAPPGFKAAIVTACRDCPIEVVDVTGLAHPTVLKRQRAHADMSGAFTPA